MGAKLQSLFRELQKGIVKNYNQRSFIPDSKLVSIVTSTDVDECLREAGISPASLRAEVKHAIENGGQKTFAILAMLQFQPVKLIVSFLRNDQLLKQGLDSKLPFEHSNDLLSILGDESIAKQFFETQWATTSPLFREDLSHRELHYRTVLPFIRNKERGQGGFGTVYEVTLDQAHHGFSVPLAAHGKVRALLALLFCGLTHRHQACIARKEMILDSDPESFENEKRILSLLRQLRHENIIPLLASYSIKISREEGSSRDLVHNLLFLLADESLEDLLKYDREDALRHHVSSDHTLFQQLYSLSSAIESLHNYEDSTDQLRLKGCHFDLAPRNILLWNKRLLLADFGLSRLRNEDSDSCSPLKGGPGLYAAPECFGEDFGPEHKHGRSSDIRSFGAILVVLVTFMRSGATGVEQFKAARKHKSSNGKITYRFHADGKQNPGVDKWIRELEVGTSDIQKGILSLAREMLSIDPSQRPLSTIITESLFLLTQRA